MQQQLNLSRSFDKLQIQTAIIETTDKSLFAEVLRLYVFDMFDSCIVMIVDQCNDNPQLVRRMLGSDVVDKVIKYAHP